MFSPCWVLVIAGVLASSPSVTASTLEVLDYECGATSGVIVITNPDPSTYIWAQVNTSDYICNTTLVSDKIFVYGCLNKSLTMLLSNENGVPVIITSVIKSYRLKCSALLPETGVTQKVIDDTHVLNYMSTSVQPSVAPTILINTTMVDAETGAESTTATIGQQFLWSIWGPGQYSIVPEYCTTYSDPLPDTTLYSVDTHLNGCTVEDSLVSDFRYYNASKNLVVADVFAFRFPNSDQIYLYCQVRGCPENSTACEFTCPSTGKKKRSEDYGFSDSMATKKPDEPIQYVVATTLRPTPTPSSVKNKRSGSNLSRGKAEISMTVIGEPNIFIDDLFIGACPGCHGDVLLLLTMVIVAALSSLMGH